MTEAPLMLGVSGLRGIVGKSLTPEVAARYTAAFGQWLGARPRAQGRARRGPEVVIGSDGRTGSEAIVQAATSGLLASGCGVLSAGVAMTPTIGTIADALGLDGGIVITASHNPQQWNGIKIMVRDPATKRGAASACAPGASIAAAIIARFHAARDLYRPWDEAGSGPRHEEHSEAHIAAIESALESIGVATKYKKGGPLVALDSVGGAGGVWSKNFLAWYMGCRVHASGEYATGRFTHTPEPTRENLKGFRSFVRKHKARIGFAQDPDADRLAIVDERGEYIGEEYTLALAAESLLSETAGQRNSEKGKKPRILVTNLSTSRMLDDIAAAHGARVVRTPVGEANVVEAMKREKAAGHDVVLGGEGNGGVIWPRVTYVRDSLSAMALVLSLMARTGKKVSELVGAIPAYAIEKRKVDLARKEDARPAVEKIAAAYRDQRVDLQDGVRIDWPKAWLHVRASNTEPIMRLIAEAPTAAESRAILDEAACIIAG